MSAERRRAARAAEAARLARDGARLMVAAGVLKLTNAVDRFAEQVLALEQQERDEVLYAHPDLMDLDAEVERWYSED